MSLDALISRNGRRLTRTANLVGQTFHRLTVVGRNADRKGVQWDCVCICGGRSTTTAYELQNGRIKSCGCYIRERFAKASKANQLKASQSNVKHGLARKNNLHPLYRRWLSMWYRCTKPNNRSFPDYGGRGISVCERWKDFTAFLADMGDPPTPAHTLDRFPDKDGNYEPGNVRWATPKEQAQNRRQRRMYRREA
jgi:hypothetical protein